MGIKGWAITMGLGVAAGAVAILTLPKSSAARQLAAKAADKVEDVAWMVSDKLTDEFDL